MLNFLEVNKNTILKDGNPILRMESKDISFPLSDFNQDLVKKMKQYLMDSNDEKTSLEKNLEASVGIAAPQIGYNINLFAIAMEDADENLITEIFINPKILKKSKELIAIESGEGCLSIPNKKSGYVYRSNIIDVEYFNENGKLINATLEGFYAIAFQHEYDHLKGILYIDHINKEEPFIEKKGAIFL